MNSIIKIAHRGASGIEAENTLTSFEKAIGLKVDGIELDVHLSYDSAIIVIHDDTINRTTNGTGFVNQRTALELKKHGIPTLIEVLELVNRNCFLNIELKGMGTSKSVVDLITDSVSVKNWNYSDFLVSSFDSKMLEEVHLSNPKIRIGILTEASLDEALALAKKINAYSIHPDYRLLTKENVVLMQEYGFKVFTYTVNSIEDIEKIKAFNVDGIISDFPDRI